MLRFAVAWALVAVHAVWLVVRLFGFELGYPLMPLLAYTPYVAATALVAAVVALVLRVRRAALVAALICAGLVALVAPRALGGPTEAQGGGGEPLRIMTFDLQRGAADPAAIARLVAREDIDVLILQAVDAAALARLDAALGDALPSRVAALGRRSHGTALYAHGTLRPLDAQDDQARALVAVPGAQAVEVVAVHPLSPGSAARVDLWRADMRVLPAATPTAGLRVLAGDFNATLDHPELRRLIATGYVDAAGVVGEGLRPSWPVGRLLPPVTIDHVLADRRCGVRGVEVHRLPGSEHRAVTADLQIPR
jgi:endonuclease/exonuclease/phosphatase family metal-dependent hydrolase